MIYLYHKIDYIVPTYRWVSADAFNRQMAALQSKKVVYLDDYDRNNPDHVVITFDGGYENIATVATPILKKWGYPFEVFVIGKYIGGDNTFDAAAEPFCRFATVAQLQHIADNGGRIQWHTMTHRILQNVTPEIIQEEILVPNELRQRFPAPHFGWFAYPHGRSDQSAVNLVHSSFRGALVTGNGESTDRYQMFRKTVREGTNLFISPTYALVWANGDPKGLALTLDSLKRQSIPPIRIFVLGPQMSTSEELLGRAWEARTFDGPALGIENAGRLFASALAEIPEGAVLSVACAGAYLSQNYIEMQRAELESTKSDCVLCTTFIGDRKHQITARSINFDNFIANWEHRKLFTIFHATPMGTRKFYENISDASNKTIPFSILENSSSSIYIYPHNIKSNEQAFELALLEITNSIERLKAKNEILVQYKKKNEAKKKKLKDTANNKSITSNRKSIMGKMLSIFIKKYNFISTLAKICQIKGCPMSNMILKTLNLLLLKAKIKYSPPIRVTEKKIADSISREKILAELQEKIVVFSDVEIYKETSAIGIIDTQIDDFFETISKNISGKFIFETSNKFSIKTKITNTLVQFAKKQAWFRIKIKEKNVKLHFKIFIWRKSDAFFADTSDKIFIGSSNSVLARYIQPQIDFADKKMPPKGNYTLPSFHAYPLITRVNFPIDIVYTWVNHADKGWQQLIAPYREGENNMKCQYFNSDELKYSMRSVYQHAPWVRKIFVLTNCAPPAWLKPSEKIVWVDHADVFHPDHLPCFNSHVIASYLGNIPGLSEHFIYFNDDAFIGRKLDPNFFFTSNGCSISYMGGSIVGKQYMQESKAYIKSAVNAKLLFEKKFKISPHMQHLHTPSAICKCSLLEMIDCFKDEFYEFRKNKFRSDTDLSAIAFMYHNYAYISKKTIFSEKKCKQLLIQERNFEKTSRKAHLYDIIGLNDGVTSLENKKFQIFKIEYMEKNFSAIPEWEVNTPLAETYS